MIRILSLSLIIFALYHAGGWLMAHPGHMTLDWLGMEITLHMAALAIILLVFTLLVGNAAIALWKLANWPSRRRSRRAHRTLKRGLAHLTRGITALSMGDEKTAEDSLRKARICLPNEPLPNLLTAQLLQRQGKHGDAHAQFQRLIAHPTTQGLATQKMIERHMHHHEWPDALRLTAEAHAQTPQDHALTVTYIDLCARVGDSKKMLALTEGWQWQSPLSKAERYRYAALAHYLDAPGQKTASQQERSLRHALGYASDFLPAIVAYAELLLGEGNHKKARKFLLERWRATPSPLLIPPVLQSLAHESAEAQLRLLQPFLKGERSAAHHMLDAQHAFAALDFSRAEAALEASLALDSTQSAMQLMSDILLAKGNAAGASQFRAKMENAHPGSVWMCSACSHVHPEWHTHCDGCSAFDTIDYARPEAQLTSIELEAS